MTDDDRIGHVATIVADITRVLRAHGFATINERSIRILVRDHVEAHVDSVLGNLCDLRAHALAQESLAVIALVLQRVPTEDGARLTVRNASAVPA